MEVRELTFKGETEPQLYACGKCGKAYTPVIYMARKKVQHETARDAAEKCCAPRYCDCGVKLEASRLACPDCAEKKVLRRAKEIGLDKIDGPVFAEGTHGEFGEGYSSDIHEMREACFGHDDPEPAYVHPCHETRLQLDPDSILESATEDMHEDARHEVEDERGLVEFLEAWNAKQTCRSYLADRSRVVVLDRDRFNALIAEEST